ncbi:TauD/TfdA family dioxygenase [Tropicimonas sp. IMCC34043]|uniref:TauD/TfdA family dioxygenase n=1 Tax=Tropicimonas sp. IMCC34043 TaxID=2248760 RepID=UPI000E276329|nr:TauD/TfdA family dioxygenase [Tropicimonas sp. IMCC34043]
MLNQATLGAKSASETIFDVRQMPSPLSGGWETINNIKYQAIRHELDAGCGAVTFRDGSILNERNGDRYEKFIAFGRRLGEVQIRGGGSSPIWHVEPKKSDGSPKSYSESNDVAPFHTDASYYPNPMKYLVFLAVRPAEIGGENQVFSIPDRLPEFSNGAAGCAAIEVLKRETFPFGMPPTFHNKDEQKDLPLECGPVLLDGGIVRFQIKALREGFRRRPDLASPEKIEAVEALNDFIQQHLNGRGVRLGRGQILIVNNWRALHSRKAFNDPNRLLLRLSIADTFPTNTAHR